MAKIEINDDRIKFNRVESTYNEVYRPRKKDTQGIDPGEMKHMTRVDRLQTVRIELDVPKELWDDKKKYFIHFHGTTYEVLATDFDTAVLSLMKLGFIGTQRFIGVQNQLWENLLAGNFEVYRLNDLKNAQIIAHCYEKDTKEPTQVQYVIKQTGTGLIVNLADQMETHYLIKELCK